MLRFLAWPLVKPSLGFAAASVGAIDASLFVASALWRPYGGTLLALASIPSFWISLRVLLKVGNPPKSVWGGIVFALLLLNLLFSLAGLVALVGYLWELASRRLSRMN